MIQIKEGVFIKILTHPMFKAIEKVVIVWEIFAPSVVPIITSAAEEVDGRSPHSKHYTHHALDFGKDELTQAQIVSICDSLFRLLGPNYDVIVGKDHFHVEYDPK